MPSAREAALKTLIAFRREGAWPDLYLKNSLKGLSQDDAALSTAIAYGVLQQMYLIDHYIAQYSSVKLKKIMPQVLDALRCGVYQLVFMDKVPPYAAINETVALVRKSSNPKAVGFANAVLRKIADNKDSLPQPGDIGTLYTHPQWLVSLLEKQLGVQECKELLSANNTAAPVYIRANTLKISREELIQKLSEYAVNAEPVEGIDGALLCKNAKSLSKNELFRSGCFYIQDAASQLAVTLLAPKAQDNLIDMCAAPGGKSLLAAQLMQNRGKIKAFDIHPHKTDIIDENAQRLGIGIIEAACADSSKIFDSLKESADKIICDVPCSGIGIIRKKPDIRFKSEEEAAQLPEIQRKILENAAYCLKHGGRMIYSTCTILREENEDIIDWFLKGHSDFYKIPFENAFCGSTDGSVTLYPHRNDCDGFFITLLGRE